MTSLKIAILCLVTLLVGIPAISHAADVTCTINGTTVTGSVSEGSGFYVNIEGNYGNVIIERGTDSTKPARAVTGNDSSNDSITILNTKIRVTTGTQTEYYIVCSSTFAAPPNSSNAAFSYELSGATNTVKRNATGAQDDTVRAQGTVVYPYTNGTPYTIAKDLGNPSLYRYITYAQSTFFPDKRFRNFPHTNAGDPNSPSISDSRILQIEFWFMLLNSADRLNLSQSSGLSLFSGPTQSIPSDAGPVAAPAAGGDAGRPPTR